MLSIITLNTSEDPTDNTGTLVSNKWMADMLRVLLRRHLRPHLKRDTGQTIGLLTILGRGRHKSTRSTVLRNRILIIISITFNGNGLTHRLVNGLIGSKQRKTTKATPQYPGVSRRKRTIIGSKVRILKNGLLGIDRNSLRGIAQLDHMGLDAAILVPDHPRDGRSQTTLLCGNKRTGS